MLCQKKCGRIIYITLPARAKTSGLAELFGAFYSVNQLFWVAQSMAMFLPLGIFALIAGAPLSQGVLRNEENGATLTCPYHGWRFSADTGGCALIPAISSKDKFDQHRLSVKKYNVCESGGLIWIYHGKGPLEQSRPPILALTNDPGSITTISVSASFDEAVIGLIDPAHTPFVHRNWLWRDGKPLVEKEKHFEPTELGFKMPAHKPSSNSRIYNFLGGAPTTEIRFELPGLRIETIKTSLATIIGLTTITPTDNGKVDLRHTLYWDLPLLNLGKPFIKKLVRDFLKQDANILTAQHNNISTRNFKPLYAGEPDIPAQWYFKLKRAWAQRAEDAPFINPLTEAVLHWKT